MRVAICDDEQTQRELITKYLNEWAKLRNVDMSITAFSDGSKLLFAWEEDKAYDLLVLDIEMGESNGVELAKKIRESDELVPILFITGYEQYMEQGYEVAALHYLVKPVNTDKLFTVLDRLRNAKPEIKLLFQTADVVISLPASRIWYIEASGHYCVLYTQEECYELRQSITALEKYLNERLEESSPFIKCHRSYIVNLQHIASIVKNELIMDNGKRLPISRYSLKVVNEAFINMYRC